MDPAFYNAANATQVSPTTGDLIAGSGDTLNGTVLWGDGFTAAAKNHVPIAASGQYDNLFHDLPRGYITPTGLRRTPPTPTRHSAKSPARPDSEQCRLVSA